MAKKTTQNIARTIYEQMGADSFRGAIIITGGQNLVYGDDAPLQDIEPNEETGAIELINGLAFEPNVEASGVKFIVVLQPGDFYTIFLWRQYNLSEVFANGGKVGELLYRTDGVFFDMLIDMIDDMYVRYIRENQPGFLEEMEAMARLFMANIPESVERVVFI